MSGTVSYALLNGRLPTSSGMGFTPEGGLYITYINGTGATSVKGTIVVCSSTQDNAVSIAPASSLMPIGVVYDNGIANGGNIKVVVLGKAQVLLINGTTSTRGYWCGVGTTAGRMTQQSSPPSSATHNSQIGTALQSIASGTNVLALIQIHTA